MTRRGVIRWAGRAFGVRPLTVRLTRQGAECGVELTTKGWGRRLGTGASWGAAERESFEEPPIERWDFRSQLVRHEEDMRAHVLRVLAHAPAVPDGWYVFGECWRTVLHVTLTAPREPQ